MRWHEPEERKGVKILVVDDSRAMRLLVQRALRQAGFGPENVQEAEDGAQALEAVRASPPDLILSDWNMPKMSGIDLLGALRAEGRPVPFVFVTSENTSEMRDQARAAGALGLVNKPFGPEQIRAVLSPLLKR